MQTPIYLCAAAAFLNLCCAQEIPCNVTQTPQGIIYKVPEFQAVDCDYHWDNASGHVLSNHKGKIDELVLKSSDRSVTISRCLAQLNYTRDCISEGIQRTAYCVTDCRTPRNYCSTIISFSITALLVMLVLLGCICSADNNAKNQHG